MKQQAKRKYCPKTYGIIGGCIILLALVLGFLFTKNAEKDALISIDVNPSIELKINHKDMVLQAIGINQEGENVLKDMNLKGSGVKVATNAIIGSLFQQGYLNNDKKDVLVSVMSGDKEKADALREDISKGIVGVFSSQKIAANVLNQTIKDSGVAETMSEKYKISLGKAVFIEKMLQKDSSFREDALAKMSILDLNQLVMSRNLDLSASVSTNRDDALVAELSLAAKSNAELEAKRAQAEAEANAAKQQAALNGGGQSVPNLGGSNSIRPTGACSLCSPNCTCHECFDDDDHGCDRGCDDCNRDCKNYRSDRGTQSVPNLGGTNPTRPTGACSLCSPNCTCHECFDDDGHGCDRGCDDCSRDCKNYRRD